MSVEEMRIQAVLELLRQGTDHRSAMAAAAEVVNFAMTGRQPGASAPPAPTED